MSYQQTIYNRLRQHGISQAGALGVLGNWECESNCEPNRVQGDFSPYRNASREYVANVTSEKISRQTFGHDGRGFGVYQLTYFSRKLGYYDYWKESGKPLDDAELQTDYAIQEMKTDFAELLRFLRETNDVYQAASRVCREFERPAVNNIDARFQAAQRIRHEIDLAGWEKEETATEEDAPPGWATMPVKEPGELQNGAVGAEVSLLQAFLCWHDFFCRIDGDFGNETRKAVLAFQSGAGLKTTGICDRETWNALKW